MRCPWSTGCGRLPATARLAAPRRPSGRRRGRSRGGRRRCRRTDGTAAGRVGEVFTTRTSPASRKRGRSAARAWMSAPVDRSATSMRTSSRRRPSCLDGVVGDEVRRAPRCRATRSGSADGGHHATSSGVGHVGDLVAAGREGSVDQRSQPGHAVLGQRAVGDVLAREGVLVHLGSHVARVDAQHAEVGSLGAEDGGELLEACLGGGVGAPALVGLDGGVGGDGDDGGAGPQVGEERLHDPELGDEVRLQGACAGRRAARSAERRERATGRACRRSARPGRARRGPGRRWRGRLGGPRR